MNAKKLLTPDKLVRPSKCIARDKIGEVLVTTVFLGSNHGTADIPLYYETLIYGGPHAGFRMKTKDEDAAKRFHYCTVLAVQWGYF